MPASLPEGHDDIRRAMLQEWIVDQPTIEAQISGLLTVLSSFQRVLEPLLGRIATNAVISRASILASEECPDLRGINAMEGRLELSRVRANLQGQEPESAGKALAVLVDELFAVLYALLGNVLTPVLLEVQGELASRRHLPHSDKEEL